MRVANQRLWLDATELVKRTRTHKHTHTHTHTLSHTHTHTNTHTQTNHRWCRSQSPTHRLSQVGVRGGGKRSTKRVATAAQTSSKGFSHLTRFEQPMLDIEIHNCCSSRDLTLSLHVYVPPALVDISRHRRIRRLRESHLVDIRGAVDVIACALRLPRSTVACRPSAGPARAKSVPCRGWWCRRLVSKRPTQLT
jgi:hypothetical protein